MSSSSSFVFPLCGSSFVARTAIFKSGLYQTSWTTVLFPRCGQRQPEWCSSSSFPLPAVLESLYRRASRSSCLEGPGCRRKSSLCPQVPTTMASESPSLLSIVSSNGLSCWRRSPQFDKAFLFQPRFRCPSGRSSEFRLRYRYVLENRAPHSQFHLHTRSCLQLTFG